MVIRAPRFATSFRQLCQVAALAGSGRVDAVIDGLLIVVMLYGYGPWREAVDWTGAIEELFELSVKEEDMQAAIDRARSKEIINYNTFERTFQLSQTAKADAEQRITQAEELEKRVQAAWLEQVGVLVLGVPSDSLWRCLQLYMARAFAKHGADVLAVINGDLEAADDDVEASMRDVLVDSIKETGLQTAKDEVIAAIREFFREADSERSRYVSELVDSAFNLLALGSDPSSARLAANAIGKLRIMLDTNVVFGIIDAQESAEAATARELVTLIKASNLQVEFLYHEKTLKELEFVITDIGDRLKRRHWTPSLSRVMLSYPGRMTSIEARYHRQNAETPTSPQVFMGKYDNMRLLLDSLGCKIYRDPPPTDRVGELELRGSLIAEYTAYVDDLSTRYNRGVRGQSRGKSYEEIDHDITIWLSAFRIRGSGVKSPLRSGIIILTADSLFQRFERAVLLREFTTSAELVRPSALVQALRPFLNVTPDLDEIFVRIFAVPEFRSIGGNADDILLRIASYLATYADLPEDLAAALLADQILHDRLEVIQRDDEEMQQAIDEAMVRQTQKLAAEVRELQTEIAEIKASRADDEDQRASTESSASASLEIRDLREQVSRLSNSLQRERRQWLIKSRVGIAVLSFVMTGLVVACMILQPPWYTHLSHPVSFGVDSLFLIAAADLAIFAGERRWSRWVSGTLAVAAVGALALLASK